MRYLSRKKGKGAKDDAPQHDPVDLLIRKYRREMADSDDEDDFEDDDLCPKPKVYFVDLWPFNLLIGFFIIMNAVTVGFETDARIKGDAGGVWYVLEIFFCFVFLLELSLRIYYHRHNFFTQPHDWPWNIFDILVVLVALIDTFFLTPLAYGGTAKFVLLLRFVRPLRLVRLLRLFRIFKELWLVAHGFLQSLKIIAWVGMMLIICIYICAIFLTLMVGHNDEQYDPYFVTSGGWDHEVYFKTVGRSFLSLLQVVTLDSWSEGIARHVAQEQPWMIAFFILFVFCTTFGLLNVIVGVIVENSMETASKDSKKTKKKKEKDRQMVFSQLREIFEMADVDDSGSLTLEEVQDALNKPEIYNKLKMIDFPVDDPKQIFLLLDFDDTGELTIEEFITGCVRMKGQAKSKDLLVAQVAVDTMRRHYQEFEKELEAFQQKLRRLDVTARAIVGHGEHVFLDMREFRKRHPEERRKQNDGPQKAVWAMDHAPWEEGLDNTVRALADKASDKWDVPKQPALADFSQEDQLAMMDKTPTQVLMNKSSPKNKALVDQKRPFPLTDGMVNGNGRQGNELALAVPGTVG
jgi:voltage-gated sodium channel